LKADEMMFMRVLFDVERAFGRPVPAEFTLPLAQTRAIIPWEEVKREFFKMAPDDEIVVVPRADETEAEAIKRREERDKKRRQRAGAVITKLRTKLTQFGVIGTGGFKEEGFCWWTGKPLRGFPETMPKEAVERPFNEKAEDDDDIPF
jgi:hypothetical protein